MAASFVFQISTLRSEGSTFWRFSPLAFFRRYPVARGNTEFLRAERVAQIVLLSISVRKLNLREETQYAINTFCDSYARAGGQ